MMREEYALGNSGTGVDVLRAAHVRVTVVSSVMACMAPQAAAGW